MSYWIMVWKSLPTCTAVSVSSTSRTRVRRLLIVNTTAQITLFRNILIFKLVQCERAWLADCLLAGWHWPIFINVCWMWNETQDSDLYNFIDVIDFVITTQTTEIYRTMCTVLVVAMQKPMNGAYRCSTPCFFLCFRISYIC